MALLARVDCDRRAVVHARDQIVLNHHLTRCILPHPPGMVIDDLLPGWASGKAVNIGPLLDDLRRVHSRNGQVLGPMPDGYPGPRSPMWRGRSHQVTPFPRRTHMALEHAPESFGHTDRTPVGDAGD